MKRKMIGLFLAVAMLASFAFSPMAFTAAAVEEDEYQTVVKTLVNEGGGSAQGGSEWAPVGNFSAYNQDVEIVYDDNQDDGGDVIMRTALDVAGTGLTTGSWGYSKHSETKAMACYDINGLVIKYYDSTSTQKFIMFNENYGQLNSGRFFGLRFNMGQAPQGATKGRMQLGLWYQGNPNGSYTWDNTTWAWGSPSTYNNDYDYFSDPAAEAYNGTGTFTGTVNTIEFKLDSGDLCVFLNGEKMFNLVTAGVVSSVISECTEGMYVSFWGDGSSGTNALKVTDIYNVVKTWDSGAPQNYTTTDATSLENKISSTGAVQVRNADTKTNYNLTYTVEQYLADITTTFSFDGKDLSPDDSLSMLLGDDIELEFKKVDDTNAKLAVIVDGNNLGSEDIPFNFSDTQNTVSVKELKDYSITVNGNAYTKSLSSISGIAAGLTGGKVKVGFAVKASADSLLTIISYASSPVEVLDKVDGMTVSGSNTVIKPDGKYFAVYNTADGEFKAIRTDSKAIADSFNIKYRYGATNSGATNFRIVLGGKLIFDFTKKGDGATLSVITKSGDSEETAASKDIAFNWSYGDKELRFVNDKGYSYILMDANAELFDVDKATDADAYNKIKAIVDGFTDKMAEMSFEMKNGQSIFAFCDMKYYVETSIKAGWSAGGYGTPTYGYDDENSTTLVFNGNSMVKDKEVVVDGFKMKFRTFYDNSGDYSSPAVVISSAKSWFSLDTMGAFMFSVNKNKDTTTFLVRYALGSTRYGTLATFTIDNWNWNNNIDNEIELGITGDIWRWTVNGKALTPAADAEDYSATYTQVYESFNENIGVMQFDSGKGFIWKITEVNEVVYNVPPVAIKVNFKESYKIGEEITVDLTTAFKDANNDVLTFTILSGEGEITGNTFKFVPSKAGDYTIKVKADDGKGGTVTQDFVIKVKADESGCKSGLASVGGILTLLAAAAAVAVVTAKRRSRA